jgi:hypothetical protein
MKTASVLSGTWRVAQSSTMLGSISAGSCESAADREETTSKP